MSVEGVELYFTTPTGLKVPVKFNVDGSMVVDVSGDAGTLGQTTMANSSPVVIASDQSNLATNIRQINGVALALGQALMAASLPVALASNQSDLPANLKTVGGAALALGAAASAASVPVVIANDQLNVAIAGQIAPAAVTWTRPTDAAPYSANDVVSNSTSATTPQPVALARANDKTGYIVGVRLSTNHKSIVPRMRVHIYRTDTLTLSADNAVYKSLYADEAKKITAVDLIALATPADAANSDYSAMSDFTMRIPFTPKSGTRNVYVVLEALDAFTPASGDSFTVTLWGDLN
jgi:hypothetical protein